MRSLTGALAVSSLSLLAGHPVIAQGLGQASGYNLFTLGNASNSNVDALGKVAVGGNANFSNYTIASSLGVGSSINAVIGGNYNNSGGTVNGSIVAGGNAVINNASINGNLSANGTVTLSAYGTVNGNVTGGTAVNNPYTTVTGTTKIGTTTLPVNFATAATALDAESAALANTAATATLTTDGYGHLSVNATNGSLNVVDISASMLASAYTLNVNATNNATVVFDVTGVGGSTFTLPNQKDLVAVSGTTLNNVLFNFGDATSAATINISGFDSSILAPLATVDGTGNQFNGEVIANTFNGNGLELHNNDLFTGNLSGASSPSVVPEPGVFVTAGAMFALIGFGLVQGRRRSVLIA